MRRHSHLKFSALAGAAILIVGLAMPGRAQDPDDLKRSVARISVMDGEVSVRRGDAGEWVAGVINAPLLAGDRIATGQNSRAEVQFDAANMLRIGGNSEIHLVQLEYNRFEVEIARGTVTYRILRPSSASVELNTPSISVRPGREGTFRISVLEAGESELTARAGDVEVFTPKGSQWVYAGQTMMARGSAADPEFQMISAIPNDEWDRWNDTRDHTLLQASNSYQYVPQGVYGAEDLDTSGSWGYVAPYGYCWRPTIITAGWAPYHNGRWAWDDWYGWTWVSYDSWGWAPYHYGRWFFDGRLGWNWFPGTLGVRHYWSPALVGFFGYGGRVGVGFGFGNIGWVPLAPYETFHPWWGRSYIGAGFNRNINYTSINITNIYKNARATNGVSGVRSEEFGSGRFQAVQHLSGTQLQNAGVVNGRLPIAPSTEGRRFSDKVVANVPRTSPNTRFYSHSATPSGAASRPIPPSGGQGSASPQSTYRRFGEPGGGAAGPNARSQPGSQAPIQRPANPQHFGEPGSTQAAPRNDRPPSAQNGSGGWRSFGTPSNSQPAPRQPYNPPPSRPAPTGASQSQQSRQPSYNSGQRAPAPSYSTPRTASPPAQSAPRPAPPASSGSHAPNNSGGKGKR